MALLMQQSNALGLRGASAPKPLARRALVCRAAEEPPKPVESKPVEPAKPAATPMGPEWAQPALKFFAAEDVKLEQLTGKVTSSDIYNNKLKEYWEGPVGKESTGWKAIPETINGRAAMLGFLAGAAAEIFGAGSILNQMAASPQSVVATISLIAVGSVVPIVKGTKGDYLQSLQDTYALPEGVFTEKLEQVHGRIAMTGLTTLIFIELFTGGALL